MTLVAIAPPEYPVELDIAYATARNFTGKPVYARAAAYLHPIAARNLTRAIELAAPLGLRLKIFDAFRPSEAQWTLWNCRPDPDFLSDPRRGSPHSRGVAIDLTLIDAKTGRELDMGTEFDTFSPHSYHGDTEVSADAQRNRHLLLGLMSAAGWDFYMREWWHYQLFESKRYPVLSDSVLRAGLMAAE
ncbi:MAG: D-alanyl-D-alanine dipeptidase [Tagaea sp.]|nr:D-alanyl-D-alanine dipeptidase [Tagaea sp.]